MHSIGLAEFGHLAVALTWVGYGVVVVQYAFQLTGPRRVAQSADGELPADVFTEISHSKLLLLRRAVLLIFPMLLRLGFMVLPKPLLSIPASM